MLKEKEYPINSYGPVRTNKDRTCVCCGDTVPAGSSRMMPRNAKSSYCLCISCFKKWKSVGGDLKLMDNLSNVKKEHIIYMSKIMKGNCDIVKGHKLYIALKKAINEKKVAVTLSLAARRGGGFLLVEIDRQFFDEMINRFNNNNIKIDRI